ncbi:MAG: hypothetical protein HY922_09485 [Elusimicrobia bacterium]|nr:hypothetical protein [Elusimicrobiota bacterium]
MSESEKPDEMLESVANLETARMTLRWALDRMRSLEAGNAEMRELLKAAASGREEAVKELERFRLSAEERLKRLSEKERFVQEMQGILNSLFKGELDVAGFVKKRQELDKAQELIEAKVRKQLAEAEELRKRELEGHARLLTEMEAAYTGALAEAQRRFHEAVAGLEKRHRAEIAAEQAKVSRAYEDVLQETSHQGEQFHQKALLMEAEFSGRRKELEKDLEKLQQKLAEEHLQAEQRQSHLHEALRERIEAEKRQLEQELALRDARVAEMRQALVELEASIERREEEAVRKAFERFEEERRSFRDRIEALRRETDERVAEASNQIEALKAELAQQESRFNSEREALLRAQQDLRRKDADMHREQLEAEHREFLERQRRRDAEQLGALETAERRHAAREAELRESLARDLETVRAAHAEELRRLEAEISSLRERHEAELRIRDDEVRRLSELMRVDDSKRDERTSAEFEALQARHARELERLSQELSRQQERFQAEQTAMLGELGEARQKHAHDLEAARAEIAAKSAAEIDGLRQRHEAESRRLSESWSARYAEQAQRLESEIARLKQRHEADLASAHQESHSILEPLRAAEEERGRRTAADFEALQAKTREEIERLAGRMQAQAEAFKAEREALLAEAQQIRQADAAKHAEALQALEASYKTREAEFSRVNETRFQTLHQEAVRRIQTAVAEVQALRAQMEKQRTESDAQRAALLEQQAAVIQQEAQKYMEQLDQMRRSYSKMLASQKEESLAESERLSKAVSELRAELTRRPEAPAPGASESAVLEGAAVSPLAGKGGAQTSAQAPKRRRLKALGWGALAAAASAAAAFAWVFVFSGRDYAVPFSHPTGLVWEGDILWASDWYDQSIHQLRLGPSGLTAVRRFPVPAHILGMTRVNGAFYIVDSWARLIERWVPSGDALVLDRSWPSPGEKPSAVHYDGKSLWTADSGARKIYRHLLDEDLTVAESYSAGDDPVGLGSDAKGDFWSADGANRLFLRRLRDANLSFAGAYRLPEILDDAPLLSCFAWRGRKLWIGREGSFRLIERPWWRLRADKAALATGPSTLTPSK